MVQRSSILLPSIPLPPSFGGIFMLGLGMDISISLFPPVAFEAWGFKVTKSHVSMVAVFLAQMVCLWLLPKCSETWRWIRGKYYAFVSDIVESNAGHEAGFMVPVIHTIFSIILFSNLIGMIPGVFPPTCDLYLNFFMSSTVIFSTLIIAIRRQGAGAISLFCPSAVPKIIKPFLVAIEMPLFFLRIITLACRLLLNITAGHMVVDCILNVANENWPISIMYLFIMGIELIAAILQACIFVMLSSIYLSGAIHSH